MKTTYLFLICVFMSLTCFAQLHLGQNLYCFKTYEDFFANKKVYLGKITKETDAFKYKLLDTVTGKEFKVKFSDSSYAGIGFTSNRKYIFDPKDKNFYVFLGGNKCLLTCFSAVYGISSLAKFDSNGEFKEGSLLFNEVSYILYIKNLDFKNIKYYMKNIISDNPTVLAEFENETSSNKEQKRIYANNFIEINNRYIKKYCGQK